MKRLLSSAFLVASLITLSLMLFSPVAQAQTYQHTVTSQANVNTSRQSTLSSQLTYSMEITRKNGQSQTYTAPMGQEIIIPLANGMGTVHFSEGFTSTTTSTSGALIPEDIPYRGCGDAWTDTAYYSTLGLRISYYKLTEHACNNALAITFLGTPQESYSTIPGITMSSHSTSTNWIQQPWSAQATGNYSFLTGIPTPWGGVGSTCSGWVRITLLGDGPTLNSRSTCL
jgi:hypothetical protein